MVLLYTLFLVYFIALSAGYLLLNLSSLLVVRKHARAARADLLPRAWQAALPPISMLVPAYNEADTITGSVRSLLQLTYPEHEVIVINDGSKDDTFEVLRQQFDLIPEPPAFQQQLPSQPIRGVWQSRRYRNLRVIDKANGGKADALNAGINLAHYPLFCSVDADSLLKPDSLQRIVRPFLEDPDTIAAGGTVRIANGCEIHDGLVRRVALPEKLLPRLQVMEYLRAFLFGRMGWSPINAMLIISGAFGVFRKASVVEVGGYRQATIGEDMELVMRLHHHMRLKRQRYRILFIPDPVCWTQAPEDLRTLKAQRVRWQRGLLESLSAHKGLLFHPRGGTVSWLATPFQWFFEGIGPLIEVTGYVLVVFLFFTGLLEPAAVLAFLLVAVGLGMLVSVIALLLEELSFPVYTGRSSILRLFATALLENLGYRQLNSFWRLIGILKWASGQRAQWGDMKRTSQWTSDDPPQDPKE